MAPWVALPTARESPPTPLRRVRWRAFAAPVWWCTATILARLSVPHSLACCGAPLGVRCAGTAAALTYAEGRVLDDAQGDTGGCDLRAVELVITAWS